ncbi:class I SAM-dependent methyltransferase [Histomonas meleagridis]|uniref:class I SAM-dependent methyltransferase n=1 Tax=Histomonas meleagridis TaxID=135588 RepID=UPI00355A4C00|nr:class I SAM-dependent methyltransferase [Histomonas meleagridis]KAH0798244.1 class I SAM-dependent methyltransferase [Histomonas meleagridis]
MSKCELTGVPETLLIPLLARALEQEKPQNEIRFSDPKALEIKNQIDYDFTKFDKNLSMTGCQSRTILIDRCLGNLINENPNCVFVNLGCGLDTRFFRLDNGQLDWYDLDLPEVIEFRRNFIEDTERHHAIPKSIFDESWSNDVKVNGRKVIILCEGTSMYFTREQNIEMLTYLKTNFPGASFVVELMTPFIASHSDMHDTVSQTSAHFEWGTYDPKEIEAMCPGIKFIEYWSVSDEMKWWAQLFRYFNNYIAHYEINKPV